MKLRFIGKYTGGRNTISYPPYTFVGHEPTVVDARTGMGRRLSHNPEFEEVEDKTPPKSKAKKPDMQESGG